MVKQLIKNSIVPYIRSLVQSRDKKIATGAVTLIALLAIRHFQRRNTPQNLKKMSPKIDKGSVDMRFLRNVFSL